MEVTRSVGQLLKNFRWISDTWNARHSWLKRGFKFEIASTSEAGDLDILINARNAIVHGGGALTFLQTRDTSKRVAFERELARVLAVRLSGARLTYSASTPELATTVVRKYLLRLDTELKDAPRFVRVASLHP